MKISGIFSAVVLSLLSLSTAVAAGSKAERENIFDKIPACAVPCVSSTMYGICSRRDARCLCSNMHSHGILDGAKQCVKKECGLFGGFFASQLKKKALKYCREEYPNETREGKEMMEELKKAEKKEEKVKRNSKWGFNSCPAKLHGAFRW